MNLKKLKSTVEELKEDFGAGLLAADVYSSESGQSIFGYNTNPQACALFNKVTGDLNSALKGAKFPELGNYYMLDLVDEKMVIVVTLADYQLGMLLDKTQTSLGLLLNVHLPKAVDSFEEAIVG